MQAHYAPSSSRVPLAHSSSFSSQHSLGRQSDSSTALSSLEGSSSSSGGEAHGSAHAHRALHDQSEVSHSSLRPGDWRRASGEAVEELQPSELQPSESHGSFYEHTDTSHTSLLTLSARLPPPPPRAPSESSGSTSRRSSRASLGTSLPRLGTPGADDTPTPPLPEPPLSLAAELARTAVGGGSSSRSPSLQQHEGASFAHLPESPLLASSSSRPPSRRRTSAQSGKRKSVRSSTSDGPSIIIRARSPAPEWPVAPSGPAAAAPVAPLPRAVAQAMRASHSSSSSASGSGIGLFRRASASGAAAAQQPGIESSPVILMRDGSVLRASGGHQMMDDVAATLYLVPVLRVAQEAARTLKALSREVYVPMALAGLHMLAPLLRNPRVSTAARQAVEAPPLDPAVQGQLRAEHWKHTLATSSLLSPALSISSYAAASGTSARRRAAAPTTTRLARAQRVPPRTSALPQLSARGVLLRNAALLAVLALLPLLRSFRLWARISLAIACATWAACLFCGSEEDARVVYDVAFRTTDESVAARRAAAEAEQKDEGEKDQVVELVAHAQQLDRQVNAAISAVQEVELVARGYKLSHPLPPISRIEARDSAASRTGRGAAAWGSPSGALNGSSGARLSRSSSGGAAWRARATSLNGAWATGTSAAAPEEPRRLAELRRCVAGALDEARRDCARAADALAPLVEKQELALLRQMYALEESGGEGTAAAGGGGGVQDLLLSPSHDAETIDARSAPPFTTSSASRPPSWSLVSPSRTSKRTSVLDGSLFSGPLSAPLAALQHDDAATANASASTSSTGHRRLSLLSDAGSGALPGASSTLGRRASLIARGGDVNGSESPLAPRPSSRLAYVSEKSGATATATPNDSGALKRLSYQSVASSAHSTWTPNSRPSSMSWTAESPLSSQGAPPTTYSTLTSPHLGFSSHAGRRTSGTWTRPAPLELSQQVQTHGGAPTTASTMRDPNGTATAALSLMGLKSAFEEMHAGRRQALVHLLAYDYVAPAARPHWPAVLAIAEDLSVRFASLAARLESAVAREMGTSKETAAGSGAASNALEKHLGVEDRTSTMGQLLRSVQAKLRATTAELQLCAPAALHGHADVASIDASTTAPAARSGAEAVDARTERAERVFESIREDLLALSAEWEATLKIMRSERERKSALSPQPSSSSDAAAARLRSPQEADEDALAPWTRQDLAPTSPEEESEALAFEEAAKAARKLRHTNSYRAEQQQELREADVARMLFDERIEDLPRPGRSKVDVYEFDAAETDDTALVGGVKMDRAQRIQLQRARRAEEQERDRATAESTEKLGVEYLPELKATLATREESLAAAGLGHRGQGAASASAVPPPPRTLGAPLEIAHSTRAAPRPDASRTSSDVGSSSSASAFAPPRPPRRSSSSSSSSGSKDAASRLSRPHASRSTSAGAAQLQMDQGLGERMHLARQAAEKAAEAMTQRREGGRGRAESRTTEEGGFAY